MNAKNEALKKVETAQELPSAKNLDSTKNRVENTQKSNEQELKEKTFDLIKKFELTPEKRLQRVENLRILGQRFAYLKKKEDELSKFIVSSDGTKEKIVLTNANGFNFEVSNSQTVEKVVQVIENDLKEFIKRAEEEVLKFEV